MKHRFKFVNPEPHNADFTEGKEYEVSLDAQRYPDSMRLGVVHDDDGDARVFFAEDFEYVGPVI